ncbi:MAG: WD40 repeat domain-containing serine/threonine protein kinase [Planctomycetota bacterium]|nr:WD40 repeat domain-containing serine/threonine protein kinase [Planctomycetota bacterium]
MTVERDSSSSTRDERFMEIVRSFELEIREGKIPSIAEWAKSNPEFKSDIQELFPGLLLMEHASRSLDHDEFQTQKPETIGPYQVIRRLGHGGMGVVYLAHDPSLNRLVAVKILASNRMNQDSSVQRFFREAQAVGKLFHPHIVQVYSTGQTETVPYYAMQFVRGCALSELMCATRFAPNSKPSSSDNGSNNIQLVVSKLADNYDALSARTEPEPSLKQLTWRDATRITREVGSALAHAHAQGILHRDIKPANILVGSDGHAWVVDFGLCRLEGEHSMTGTGEAVGTLRYMAPEQLDGESDESSDVYSLGLVLYEMVTGAPAMTDTRKAKLIRSIALKDPISPRRLVPKISKDLETIICKAISKRPVDRYASANQLVRDLERLEAGQAIEARRPSALYHLGLFARRHQALTAVSVGGLMLITLLVAMYTQELKSKERNRAHGEYSARLNAAEAALQTGATARALQQLALADEPLRGWEWNHLSAKVDQSLQGFDTKSFARDVAISPDGTGILTCTADGTFLLRAVAGQFEIKTVFPGSSYACAWHPSDDVGYFMLENGSLKSTAPQANTIQLSPYPTTLVVTESGHALSGSARGHVDSVDLSTGMISRLARRSDLIVSMERQRDDSVWICDQTGWQAHWIHGSALTTLPSLASVPLLSASQSPDGKVFAVLPRDGVPLWMHKDGMQPHHHLQSPPAHMNRVQFSPSGQWLSGTNHNGFVHLWDAQGGQQAEALTGHHTKVMSLDWHPRGEFFATGDEHGKLRIWHPTARGGGFVVGHHVFDVGFTSISPDGNFGLSASRDGTFGVWDLQGGRAHKRVWSIPTGVSGVIALGKGNEVAVVLNTGEIQLWNLDQMEKTASRPILDRSKRSPAHFAVHSGRQSIFAIGVRHPDSASGSIEEWSQESLQFKRVYSTKNTDIQCIAIDEARQWLLATTVGGRLEVVDLNTGQTKLDVQVDPEGRHLNAFNYCEEKAWALCMSRNNRATIVDVVSGEILRTLWRKGDVIQSGTFLQGGNRVALGSRRGAIGIWDPRTGDHLIDLTSVEGWVGALSASPDGTALLAGTSTGSLHYIDCLSAAQRFHNWSAAPKGVNTRLASRDDSHKEAGRVAWSQLWNRSEIKLSSAELLMARMQFFHPRPGFVSALRASLAFLKGRHGACIQHADVALTHQDLSPETRSTLHGIRGLAHFRQGSWLQAAQDHSRVRWQHWRRILNRESSLQRK